MQKVKRFTLSLVIVAGMAVSGMSSAATVIDEIGIDDGVYDVYILDPVGAGPSNIIYNHTYDISGLSSISAATFEIEIVHPGGVGGSPLEIYFDDTFLASSDDRTGNEILFSFDLLALGLGPNIDGTNTVRLEAFSVNDVRIDFSRITIEGPAIVPLPAAAWLFCSGLIGLAGLARRRDRTVISSSCQ